MKRRYLIPLTFLLLVPALVADAAKVKDIPVQEGDWITATSGGKKDQAKISGCGGKNRSGNYTMAKCTDSCTSKFWRWRFWVTRYKISRTFRQGEHQGIWTYGQEYKFDKRFLAKDGLPQPWKPGITEPFLELILDPKNQDVSKYALCDLKNMVKTEFNNHGRTLATVPPVGSWDMNITGLPIRSLLDHSIGPLDYKQWSDADDSDSKKVEDTTQCIDNIHDGYCDSVCGNCSYVLPPGLPVPQAKIGTYPGQTFAWKEQETAGAKVNYTVKQTIKLPVSFVVVPMSTPIVQPIMRTWRDDFTHCVKPGTAPQQSFLIGSLDHIDGVITGLWGHNSNTDAEAEFRQFKACIEDPSVDKRSSCDACGVDRFNSTAQRMEQWPCVNGTNEAKEDWSRSTHLPGVDDNKAGTYSQKMPYCLDDTQRPVKGM